MVGLHQKSKKHHRNALGPAASVSALRDLPIFRKASNQVITQLEDMAESVVIPRDELLIAPVISPPRDESAWIIISGQLGVGLYDQAMEEAAAKRVKKEVFKHTTQTLALFTVGDVFYDEHLIHLHEWSLYAVTEVRAIKIPARLFKQCISQQPKLLNDIKAHQEERLQSFAAIAEDPARADIIDFYVKNGFSFSTRTKIRQLELCIDCDKCVQACEDRHGLTRLERFGPEVGLISFSISCRQCYDPRCLIECNFDAIAREPESGEIRIVMERCTGCAVCVRNCPNDSIFLHRTEDRVDANLFAQSGRRVPKKTATKCDRCTGFDDMACITACPTGSMIDADPFDIFNLLQTNTSSPMSPTDFEQGLTERQTRFRLEQPLYILGAITFCLTFVEWAARLFWSTTFWSRATQIEEQHLMSPQSGFGYWLGILGAIGMGFTLLYVFRKRVKQFERLGPLHLYLIGHNLFGTLGLGLVFLHGGLHFSKWPALGIIAGLCAVVSGFVGNYIQNQLPGVEFAQKQRRQSMNAVLHELSSEWGEHTRSANLADILLTLDKAAAQKDMQSKSAIQLMFMLVREDIQDRWSYMKLKTTRLRDIKNPVLRQRAKQAYRSQQQLRRNERYYQALSPLMRSWRGLHIFCALGLYVVGLTHMLAVWLS